MGLDEASMCLTQTHMVCSVFPMPTSGLAASLQGYGQYGSARQTNTSRATTTIATR